MKKKVFHKLTKIFKTFRTRTGILVPHSCGNPVIGGNVLLSPVSQGPTKWEPVKQVLVPTGCFPLGSSMGLITVKPTDT